MLDLTAGRVDLARGHVIRRDGAELALTSTERALLGYLAAHPSRDLPRAELLAEVWGYGERVSTRALDTAIKLLRRKIEADAQKPAHVLTVWGVGYRFEPRIAAVEGDLIGRADELARLHELTAEAHLVTIRGPGGVGKTRLLRELLAGMPDATFIDLSEVHTAEGLTEAVALAFPGEPGVPLSARLRGRVALDNVEQLIQPVRDAQIAGSGVSVITTSREALGLPGERVFDLAPLTVDAGVRLLRRRVAQARREEPRESDAELARVVEALDGLPLALELTAARAGVLGLDEILARDPSRVAASGGVVQASVARSLGRLDREAREVLAVCALFRGRFTTSDVQAVVGEGIDVIGPLERARDASLIAWRSDGLGMLQVVRLAVRASLVAPPDQQLRWARHVLDRPDPRAWAADLRAVFDDDRLPADVGARAGLALVPVLERYATGSRPTDIPRIDALSVASGVPRLQVEAQQLACTASLRRGGCVEAPFVRTVELARATGDPDLLAWSLAHLGTFHRQEGRQAQGLALLREALATARDLVPERQALVLAELGAGLRFAGDPTAAVAVLDEALPHARRAEDPYVEQVLLHRLGNTLVDLGHHDAAVLRLSQALKIARGARLTRSEFLIRGSVAHICFERGDIAEAAAELAWCAEHAALGTAFHRVLIAVDLAMLAVEQGDLAGAASHAAHALAHAATRPGALPESAAHLADGVWRVAAGDPGARAALERACQLEPAGLNGIAARDYLVVLDGGPPRPDAPSYHARLLGRVARAVHGGPGVW